MGKEFKVVKGCVDGGCAKSKCSSCKYFLSLQVENLMKNGWELVGGVSVLPWKSDYTTRSETGANGFQAMVRFKKEKTK